MKTLFRGCLGGTVSWASDSWFWLRSWSSDHGIQPLVGHGVCLRLSLPLSLPLSPAHAHSLSLKLKQNFIKDPLNTSIRTEIQECLGGPVSWVSNSWFWLRSWSWDEAPSQAPCQAWSLLNILSLFPSAPALCLLMFSLSKKRKIKSLIS